MAAKKKPALKIADKSQVWHLVTRGDILWVHFDLETGGLSKAFSPITGFGHAVSDYSENYIGDGELLPRRPERLLPSPYSYFVTHTAPETLDDKNRISLRQAVCEIVDLIENLPKRIMELDYKKRKASFSVIRKHHPPMPKTELVMEYPLRDEKGRIVVDVRYHPEQNRIAYRFDDNPKNGSEDNPYYENVENNFYIDKSDGSKWKLVDASLTLRGYRIATADIPWLRANMIMTGYHPKNTFLATSRHTSNKQYGKNRAIDTYWTTVLAGLAGKQGEEGIKFGQRIDSRTGETVVSARLSDVMQMMTRREDKLRGIAGGVRMANNQSLYEHNKAHNATVDAIASLSLEQDIRRNSPNIVKATELQCDERNLRRILSGNGDNLRLFSDPALFAMPRNTYKHEPVLDPVISLGFDDQLGQMRRAIMFNLNGNLASSTYDGKKLWDMSVEELALMIREERGRPDPRIRVEPVRGFKYVVPLHEAMNGEAARNFDINQMIENVQTLLAHPELRENIYRAVELIGWEDKRRYMEKPNALMEEQFLNNGFGDLDMLEARIENENWDRAHGRLVPQKDKASSISEIVYNKAMDVYNFYNGMDDILHRLAVTPHKIEFSDSKDALDNYIDMLYRIRDKMKRKHLPYLHVFDDIVPDGARRGQLKNLTREKALEFRLKFMKRTLLDHHQERADPNSGYKSGLFDYSYMKGDRVLFANPSRDFRVVDENGLELTMDYLKAQYAKNPAIVQKKLRNNDWRIQFYRLSSDPSIAATLYQFKEMGKLKELDTKSYFDYQLLNYYYKRGPKNEKPEDGRWPYIARCRWELDGIEANARMGAKGAVSRNTSEVALGAYEQFGNPEDVLRLVGEARKYYDREEEELLTHPLRDLFEAALQEDPLTGMPYDRIQHEIPGDNVVILNVPDTHLRDPLNDIRLAPYSLVLQQPTPYQREKIERGATLILRGKQTGRLFYPGPVKLKSFKAAPPETGAYEDYYAQARAAYSAVGASLPKPDQRAVLLVQKLHPVGNTRPNLDPAMQTVKLPAKMFDGLVAPILANADKNIPFTGLAMPADLCPQKMEVRKPIRFREMRGDIALKLSGDTNPETGHIYESVLKKVRRVTMNQFHDMVFGAASGKAQARFTDADARRYGYPAAFDMWEKLNQTFVDSDSQDPGREEILLLEFDEVNRKSWAFADPVHAPVAAFIHDGKPVPPSAYRAFAKAANDNGAKPAQQPARRRNAPGRAPG